MQKRLIFKMLVALMLIICAASFADAQPVTMQELNDLAERVLALAASQPVLNDPTLEAAASEDGFTFQYDFGVLYGDRDTWTPETRLTALQLMDETVPGIRGIAVDSTVNQVMEAIPCDNPEMNGTPAASVLYLEGSAESGFLFGRVERDGQRISAMEYAAADPAANRKISVIFGISGDGVDSIRLEGMTDEFLPDDAESLYAELEALTHQYAYARVPRSLNGKDLEIFHEGDLWFSSLSYLTAEPRNLGENVEDMLIDNDDGTWLRRVDGDGFSAVFTCNSQGKDALLVSYTILSPDLEGPRGIRLGDLFHEDFTRFRSGEGDLSDDGTTEVLYGTVGNAPYGLAEYGDGSEMVLRYVTPTTGREDVELILQYKDTVLTEITLHSLEKDEENAD